MLQKTSWVFIIGFMLFSPSALMARADHLLISEILIDAPGGGDVENHETSAEFVEIYNPGNAPVALKNYIITSYINYHLLPAGAFNFTAGADYMLQFPADSILQPHQVAVVTLDANRFRSDVGGSFGGTIAGYYAQSGSPLLFEIKDTEPLVPEMVNLKAGSGGSSENTFYKSNNGDFVALIYWNGESDLVSDVDLVQWGSPVGGNTMINKSNVVVDGPDADDVGSAYKTDARSPHYKFVPAPLAMERQSTDEVFETSPNGNGITGHDETSENLISTFRSRGHGELTPGRANANLAPTRVDDWEIY